jgi:hypothetical protein
MFYKEDDIQSNLTCPRCKLKFVNPRLILPCMETLCYNCIEETSHNGELDCYFCQSKHKIPPNGFLPNKLIAQLLTVKASEVYRSQSVERLKDKLSRIDTLMFKLNGNLETSKMTIYEHCWRLQNQIDLITELRIEEAHEIRHRMLQQLGEYQTECVENLENEFSQLSVLVRKNNFHDESEFINEAQKFLQNFTLDERVLAESMEKADVHLSDLSERLDMVKCAQFKGRLLQFIENHARLDDATMGTFEFEILHDSSKNCINCKKPL